MKLAAVLLMCALPASASVVFERESVEPTLIPQSAFTTTYPTATLLGVLAWSDVDYFSYFGRAGERVVVDGWVRWWIGFSVSVPASVESCWINHDCSRYYSDELLTYTGMHTVQVNGAYQGPVGHYMINVSKSEPEVLSLAGPINSVPEPDTLLLLMLGLGALIKRKTNVVE